MAHAIKTKVIGKNVKGKPDVKGKKFRDEMLAKAQKDGSGWVDYYFMNPKTKQLAHKTAYFELARGSDGKDYIIGSGKYFDEWLNLAPGDSYGCLYGPVNLFDTMVTGLCVIPDQARATAVYANWSSATR